MRSSEPNLSSASLFDHPFEQLLEPLRQFALPHLPAAAFVALSRTSKFLHHLVQKAPLDCKRPACEVLLPPLLSGAANNWDHMQQMLTAYSCALHDIRAGSRGRLQHLPSTPDEAASNIVWCPYWPSSAMFITTAKLPPLAVSEDHPASCDLIHMSFPYFLSTAALQPSLFYGLWQQAHNIDILWACWCRDNAHTVVFMEEHQRFSVAVCTADGSILHRLPCADAKGMQTSADRDWKRIVSPVQNSVLVPQGDGSGSVQLYTLPSLQRQVTITCPLSCPPDEPREIGAITWSADGQVFAILWHGVMEEDDMLRIFSANDGKLVASLVILYEHPAGFHEVCTWSPTAKQLLLTRGLEGAPGGLAPHRAQIINIDGSTQIIPLPDSAVTCFACWSGCGRFVYVAYVSDPKRCGSYSCRLHLEYSHWPCDHQMAG